ncbi:MAG: serine/threonine-protein kinase [Chloroflexota bacterium]
MESVGRYEVIGELGQGGMGKVLQAHDPKYNREVAIKILPTLIAKEDHFRKRFQQEAEICMALQHPSIVPVYDFGEFADQPFLVMRYMEGKSLKERLSSGPPLSIQDAVKLLMPICEALEATHQKGIVHRDVKPSNLLFDEYGYIYLSDFGIARLTGRSITLSGSNSMMGTPAYMSPEQIVGGKPVDHRCDIYALGIIFFQMLTGALPFESDSPSRTMLKHITDPIPSIVEIQPSLPYQCEDIFEGVLAKEPFDRYQTIAEFKQDITHLAEGKARPLGKRGGLTPTNRGQSHSESDDTQTHTNQFGEALLATQIDLSVIEQTPKGSGNDLIDDILKFNTESFKEDWVDKRLSTIRKIRQIEEASSLKRQKEILGRDDTFYRHSYKKYQRRRANIQLILAGILFLAIVIGLLYFVGGIPFLSN